MQETPVQLLVGKIHWRKDRLPTTVFLGFSCGSVGKESTCNAEDLDLIPGLGRSPGEGRGYPLQDSGLENSMDCIVHGVAKSQTWLSDFHFHILWYTNYISKSCIIHQKIISLKKNAWPSVSNAADRVNKMKIKALATDFRKVASFDKTISFCSRTD